MFDGAALAVLLGLALANLSLMALLVVYVLRSRARMVRTLEALRADEVMMYLMCIKLLCQSDWEVRCPACDADLLSTRSTDADQPAQEAEEPDSEDTE